MAQPVASADGVEQLVVACVQTTSGDATKDARIVHMLELVRALPPFDLLVLPEMWATGFFNFSGYEAEAETPGRGPAQDALRRMAKNAAAWVVGGSIVERGDDGVLHNASLVVAPDGEIAATYRKRHLFGHGSQERALLQPGASSTTVDAAGTRFGIALCYDLRFPEAFADYVADGCELYVVPAAWPAARVDHWEKLLAARAIEGQAFCIGCNGAGEERGMPLGGRSMVLDPWGRCITRVDEGEQAILATLDLAALREYRETFTAAAERRSAARGGALHAAVAS
jgi:predicted amidohydrolase